MGSGVDGGVAGTDRLPETKNRILLNIVTGAGVIPALLFCGRIEKYPFGSYTKRGIAVNRTGNTKMGEIYSIEKIQ